MSEQTTTIREAVPATEKGSEDLLRETLKRCSRETLEAALAYRRTGDVALAPKIVLGIIERYLDPDVAEQLSSGGDTVRFMEDLGMDSLTMIEAIMMVEESLGVAIKNEELINLRTVGDLKSFINSRLTGESDENAAEFYPFEEVAATLPQQDPFLFLQEATIDDRSAKGSYRISGSESALEGHFKGNPVFPASLMLEALGQLAVFLLLKRPPSEVDSDSVDPMDVYFTGADGVRCHRVCRPGDTLEMSVKLKRAHAPLAVFSGQILVNGEKAVSADEISLAFSPVKPKPSGPNGKNGVGHH